jgi:hypothetical protein
MDKVKEIIGHIQKYHFWILCGLVMIMGFISWYMAKSNLDAQTQANVTKIKATETEIKAVQSFPDHPNDQFTVGMDRIIIPYSHQVGIGWKKRYEQQKEYLVWPQSLIDDAEGFLDQVKDLRPIEKVPYPTPKEKEIPTTYLTVYRNFITLELPKLAKTIGAKWRVATGGDDAATGVPSGPRPSAFFGGPGGAFAADGGSGTPLAEQDNSVVFWSEENQKQILETHFSFASRNENPSTLEVLYAQEDLWVLQALMQIIKKTNGNVDANYDAAVKEINSLQIGRTARGRMGSVMQIQDKNATPDALGGPGAMPGVAMESAGPGGMTPGPGMIPGPGMPGVPGSGGTGTATGNVTDPAFERYVDTNYNPLSPEILRTAATSTDPTVAINAIAKRIPVRMRLIIDQRRLQELLANCGNHEIPVEVRQVRINCPEGAAGGDSGPSGGGGEFVGSSGGGRSGGGGGLRRLRQGGNPAAGAADAPQNLQEIEVEVYGIVYIYNPVNEQLLGVDAQSTVETTSGSGAPAPTAALPAGVTPSRG